MRTILIVRLTSVTFPYAASVLIEVTPNVTPKVTPKVTPNLTRDINVSGKRSRSSSQQFASEKKKLLAKSQMHSIALLHTIRNQKFYFNQIDAVPMILAWIAVNILNASVNLS